MSFKILAYAVLLVVIQKLLFCAATSTDECEDGVSTTIVQPLCPIAKMIQENSFVTLQALRYKVDLLRIYQSEDSCSKNPYSVVCAAIQSMRADIVDFVFAAEWVRPSVAYVPHILQVFDRGAPLGLRISMLKVLLRILHPFWGLLEVSPSVGAKEAQRWLDRALINAVELLRTDSNPSHQEMIAEIFTLLIQYGAMNGAALLQSRPEYEPLRVAVGACTLESGEGD